MDKEKKMLGVYDYTVLLTYMSAISALLGIIISLSGTGHPYCGVFFLMASGIFDAFDGKVARTKKDRTDSECKFGIQIDSLTDLVAFGALPACIGIAMLKSKQVICFKWAVTSPVLNNVLIYVMYVIFFLYFLAALCRLAYFNVAEEDRVKTETKKRVYFEGLPVTTSAAVVPFILLLQYLTELNFSLVYAVALFGMGFMFIRNRKIPKAQTKEIIIMMICGVAGLILFLVKFFFWK